MKQQLDELRTLAVALFEAGQTVKRTHPPEVWGTQQKLQFRYLPSESIAVWDESIAVWDESIAVWDAVAFEALRLLKKQKPSPHMAPDENEECGEHETCGRCGGDGSIMLSEAGPTVWGEDTFCDADRPIICPSCGGDGIEK